MNRLSATQTKQISTTVQLLTNITEEKAAFKTPKLVYFINKNVTACLGFHPIFIHYEN
jgi:hypothetical protein